MYMYKYILLNIAAFFALIWILYFSSHSVFRKPSPKLIGGKLYFMKIGTRSPDLTYQF